jgi:predicted deacylase
MVSFFLDLHSGGYSLDYIPFVSMRTSGDAALDVRAMAALKAFGAPIGMVWAHTLDAGFAQTAALRRGLVSLGGEFGGGGSVSLEGVRIVERGSEFLAHAGCMSPDAAAARLPVVEVATATTSSYSSIGSTVKEVSPAARSALWTTAGEPVVAVPRIRQ